MRKTTDDSDFCIISIATWILLHFYVILSYTKIISFYTLQNLFHIEKGIKRPLLPLFLIFIQLPISFITITLYWKNDAVGIHQPYFLWCFFIIIILLEEASRGMVRNPDTQNPNGPKSRNSKSRNPKSRQADRVKILKIDFHRIIPAKL